MNIMLFHCEKSLRTFRWLYLGFLMGLFLAAIYGNIPGGADPFPEGLEFNAMSPIGFFFWMWISIFLVYGGVAGRCERLCLVLPLGARRLWLIHIVSLLLTVVLTCVVALGIVAALNAARGIPPIKPGLVTVVINTIAVTVLVTAIVQLPDRESFEIRLNAGTIIFFVIVWIAAWLLIMFLSTLPRPAALAPLAAGIALHLFIYRSLPAIWALPTSGPSASEEEIDDFRRPSQLEKINGTVRPGRRLLHATMTKLYYRHWVTALFFPWIFFIGLTLSGYTARGLNSITLPVAVVSFMSGLLHFALSRMYKLEPLPISRRLHHAYLVLPVLAVTLLGYGIGIAVGKGSAPTENLLFYGEKRYDRSLDVRVPLEFWEIGWKGEPAPVAAENCDKPHCAWSTTLFEGADIVLYSPFHTPPGSPPAFIAEQLSRAAERVFGERIDPKEIEERYFTTGPGGEALMRGEVINIGKDYPHLEPRNWHGIIPVAALIIGIPWFLLAAISFHLYSAVGKGWMVQIVLAAVVTLYILSIIYVSSSGLTTEWKIGAFAWILVRKTARSAPGGLFMLWLLVAAVFSGGYMLSWSFFKHVEAPIKRSGPEFRS